MTDRRSALVAGVDGHIRPETVYGRSRADGKRPPTDHVDAVTQMRIQVHELANCLAIVKDQIEKVKADDARHRSRRRPWWKV